MKKAIVIVIIVAIIALAYTVTQKLKQVTVDVVDFDLTKITNKQADGYFRLKIYNPFIDVDLFNLNASVYLNDLLVANSNQPKVAKVVDGNFVYITIEFTANLNKLSLNNILELLSQQELEYSIKGDIDVKKWSLKYNAPIDYTNTFKLK